MTTGEAADWVTFEHRGPVTIVRLNRPEKLNAFHASMDEAIVRYAQSLNQGRVRDALPDPDRRGARLLLGRGRGRPRAAQHAERGAQAALAALPRRDPLPARAAATATRR